jgi:hypothetical protein
MWGALSGERTGLSFTITAGPHQRSHYRVRIPWDSRPYFTVSDSRLPISSPPTTRRVTVEVLDPASTRDYFILLEFEVNISVFQLSYGRDCACFLRCALYNLWSCRLIPNSSKTSPGSWQAEGSLAVQSNSRYPLLNRDVWNTYLRVCWNSEFIKLIKRFLSDKQILCQLPWTTQCTLICVSLTLTKGRSDIQMLFAWHYHRPLDLAW